MSDITNDNEIYLEAARGPDPDSHGQAAMLLAESLIFGLIERSVISVADAVDIVEAAKEVKVDIAADIGESPETLQRSVNLLTAISESLRRDAPAE